VADVVCCVSYTRRENAHAEASLDPNVADLAPADPAVATYDDVHIITYLRLLDADAEGADWRDVSGIVLRIDPARWMTEQVYRHLLRSGA
jgi:hypothetical protein